MSFGFIATASFLHWLAAILGLLRLLRRSVTFESLKEAHRRVADIRKEARVAEK